MSEGARHQSWTSLWALSEKDAIFSLKPQCGVMVGRAGRGQPSSDLPEHFISKYVLAVVGVALVVLTGNYLGHRRPIVCSNNYSRGSGWREAEARGSYLSDADTYIPALPRRALDRGLLQRGELARLRRFASKLMQGESVTVVALGGSVTWGAIQGNGYASQFFAWINSTFPPRAGARPHALLNRGVGGSTSSLFAACTHHFVPAEADLVVVEFAVNDGSLVECPQPGLPNDPFDSAPRREYEVLLRRLLRLRSHPSVVLLNYYSWFMSKRMPEGCPPEIAKACMLNSPGRGQFQYNGENDLAVLAAYYSLPVLSMRAALYPLLLKGGKGFNVSTWATPEFKPWQLGVLPNLDDLVYIDHMHPADDTGMRYMADLLIALVRLAGRSLEARPLGQEDEEIAAEPLLPPMVLDNQGDHFSQCYLQKEMEPLGSPGHGFRFVNEQTKKSSEKWGWVALEAGAHIDFSLDTRMRMAGWELVGMAGSDDEELAAAAAWQQQQLLKGEGTSFSSGSGNSSTGGGGDASEGGGGSRVKVLVGYLKSYEHMGTAQVACTSGCSCDPVVIDGHWERAFSLPDIVTLEVTPHAECRLRVSVLEASRSGEHKVKVLSLMVVESSAPMQSFTGGGLNAMRDAGRFSEMQSAFRKATNVTGTAAIATAALENQRLTATAGAAAGRRAAATKQEG